MPTWSADWDNGIVSDKIVIGHNKDSINGMWIVLYSKKKEGGSC